MDASLQLPLPLYTGQDSCQGMVQPTVIINPTMLITVIKTVLYRHVQRSIFQLILGSVKLTINSDLHIGNHEKKQWRVSTLVCIC